jgi:hypothetical protein
MNKQLIQTIGGAAIAGIGAMVGGIQLWNIKCDVDQSRELKAYLQSRTSTAKYDDETLKIMANNKSIQTIELIDHGMLLENIPKHLLTKTICQYAFDKDVKNLCDIPDEFQTKEMLMKSLSYGTWHHTNAKFKYDEDILLALIDHCQQIHEDKIVKKILNIDKAYLTAKIMGKLATYEYNPEKIYIRTTYDMVKIENDTPVVRRFWR